MCNQLYIGSRYPFKEKMYKKKSIRTSEVSMHSKFKSCQPRGSSCTTCMTLFLSPYNIYATTPHNVLCKWWVLDCNTDLGCGKPLSV